MYMYLFWEAWAVAGFHMAFSKVFSVSYSSVNSCLYLALSPLLLRAAAKQ